MHSGFVAGAVPGKQRKAERSEFRGGEEREEEGRADPATVLHEPKRSLVQPKAAVGIYLLRDTSDSFYDSRGDYKHDSLARRAPRWNGRLGTTHSHAKAWRDCKTSTSRYRTLAAAPGLKVGIGYRIQGN